jgi:hypothetical protein
MSSLFLKTVRLSGLNPRNSRAPTFGVRHKGSGLSLCHSGPKERYTQRHPKWQNVRPDAVPSSNFWGQA